VCCLALRLKVPRLQQLRLKWMRIHNRTEEESSSRICFRLALALQQKYGVTTHEQIIPVLASHGTNGLVLAIPARARALRHPDSALLVGAKTVYGLAFNLGHHTGHLEARDRGRTSASRLNGPEQRSVARLREEKQG